MSNAKTRRIRSHGVSLAVREHSDRAPGKQNVVLVHGYPDQQDMWDRVIEKLDHEQLHIVTYDVRGAGASDVPADTAGYRIERLVDDLVAVVQATIPEGEPVHLVGHDWGSVQLWDAVAAEETDPRLTGRLASFTSISGPSLDHAAQLSRHSSGRRLAMLNQSAHSWYIYLFHLPGVPELLWSGAGRLRKLKGRDVRRNGVNGLNLYRANILRRMRSPGVLSTDVPVQVVHPTGDRFLTEVMLDDLQHKCSVLRILRIDAGHWVPLSHPDDVAALITDHVRLHAA